MNLNTRSICYIDNREFPGTAALPSGPFGYQVTVYPKAISLVPNVMFLLNNWLADGVLVSFAADLVTRVLIWAAPPALSLLRYLRRELLGHRLSMSDVYCLSGCVLESFASPP